MAFTEENTIKPVENEQPQPDLFVSEDGVYLKDDSMGKFIKEMHELIRQTIFIPTPSSKDK